MNEAQENAVKAISAATTIEELRAAVADLKPEERNPLSGLIARRMDAIIEPVIAEQLRRGG